MCQMRKFVAIALVVLVGLGSFAIGNWNIWGGGEVRGYNPPDNLDYLILQMEWARETHQDIVDNPWRHWTWQKAGVDHSEWVEIYDQVIEALEGER